MAKAVARRAVQKMRRGDIKPSSGSRVLKLRKLNRKTAAGSIKVGKRHPRTVATKRIHQPDGTVTTVLTVKVDSKTFGSDLGYAFKKSIARARKENKKRLGVRDYDADRI